MRHSFGVGVVDCLVRGILPQTTESSRSRREENLWTSLCTLLGTVSLTPKKFKRENWLINENRLKNALLCWLEKMSIR